MKKKTAMAIFLFLSAFTVQSQEEFDELLYIKADQYYLNVAKKPDSLKSITTSYIKKKLKADELFIDFMETTMNGKGIFFATIISPAANPIMIEIPKIEQSEKPGKDDFTIENLSRSSLQDKLKSQTNRYAEYKNFMQYLEPYLQNAKTIYYSTSGVLNFINLKFFKSKDEQSLFKKYKLVRLHTAASFIGNKQQLVLPEKMEVLLVGNVQYNCLEGKIPADKTSFRDLWSYLPGTAKEINDINGLLKTKHHIQLLDSCRATEAKVIDMINNGKYDIAHFATHGFYFKNPDSIFGISSQTYPLMLTGIALSGCNNKQASLKPYNFGGLLTTYDLMNMKMGNIKLVVLSTCHSGEGSNKQSSAPLGLTLALLRQGINGMIISNQAVPDEETTIFMTTLYKYLNKNSNVDTGFMNTLNELATAYPKTNWSFFDLVH